MATAAQNDYPAVDHAGPTQPSDAAAAIALNIIYKAVWFNTACSLVIVSAKGNSKTITGGIGSCYPCQNYGVLSGGTVNTDYVLLI